MLKKALRLQTTEDFERVFRKGRPLFFGAVGCKVMRNDQNFLRLGFSLAKKHLPRAVDRNRLRRILAEPFSLAVWAKSDPLPFDIVFFTVKKPEKSPLSSFALAAENVVKYIRT